MFNSYDENGDGTLSKTEVLHALSRLEMPETYASEIFARADTNGDGVLDFSEFVHYVHSTEKEFRDLFSLIDVDNDGSITSSELFAALEALHLHPTGDGVRHLAETFRHEADGSITYEDFVETMCLLRPVDFRQMYGHSAAMFGTSTSEMLGDLRAALGKAQPRPLQMHGTTRRQATNASSTTSTSRWRDDALRMGLGGMSAVVAQTCCQPIETVKVRLQNEVRTSPGAAAATAADKGLQAAALKYGTFSNAFRVILREEGLFRGLYKGMAPATVRELSYSSLRFGMYVPIKSMMGKLSGTSSSTATTTAKGPEPMWSKIFAGGLAGGLGSAVSNPVDLIKARMQADSSANAPSMVAHFKSIVQMDGVKGLWRGTSTTVVRAVVLGSTKLASYDEIKSRLTSHLGLSPKGLPCIIGAAVGAGLLVSVTTAPIDFARTRFMTSESIAQRQKALGLTVTSEVYTSGFDVMQKVVKREGVMALYRGFLPQWARIAPYSIIQFMAWEQMCQMVGIDAV